MYREHRLLSPALRPLVACVWTLRAGPAPSGSGHRVLPDGCMDVLFSLGGPPREETAAGAPPARYVVGAMTRPLDVRHAGALDLVGVRFRPGAAPGFVDVPAGELTDGIAPLDDVWGALADEAWLRLAEARGRRARLEVVEEALLRALRDGHGRLDRTVLRACRAVAAADAPVRVDDVVREAGVGRRQLERRFRAAVGLSPGAAARVQRFRRALAALDARPEVPLARIAVTAGYHDQPHLTREFRALAGETPGRWRALRRGGGDTPPPDLDDAIVQDGDAGAV